MRVFLVGFMGAGKTTVGRLLAEQLRLPFFDIDEEVEAAAGCSIAEIFEARGEAGFREDEQEALKAVLEHPAGVISTGGGLPCQDENWNLLETRGTTVWLDAPFSVLCRRVASDPQSRPLFEDRERARALYLSRKPAYSRAELRVGISAKDSPLAVATYVARKLGDRPCAS